MNEQSKYAKKETIIQISIETTTFTLNESKQDSTSLGFSEEFITYWISKMDDRLNTLKDDGLREEISKQKEIVIAFFLGESARKISRSERQQIETSAKRIADFDEYYTVMKNSLSFWFKSLIRDIEIAKKNASLNLY